MIHPIRHLTGLARNIGALVAAAQLLSCLSFDALLYVPVVTDHYTFAFRDEWPVGRRVPPGMWTEEQLIAEDGSVVFAIFARQPTATMATAPTVIYHHGNAGNIDYYNERVGLLYSLGANVLIYDFPGFGRSPGRPSEATLYLSARAAIRYVRTTLGAQIDQSRVFNYGVSVGGGPATEIAATGAFRGLILESAFTSISAMAADGSFVVPRSFLLTNNFDNRSKIRNAAIRSANGVLIYHGSADELVNPRYATELDQEIASGEEATPRVPPNRHQLVVIAEANHSDVPCATHVYHADCVPAGDEAPYLSNLRAFLAR